MKRRLLETLCCPLCRRELALISERTQGEMIDQALLVCAGCGHPFAVADGIPNMLSPHLPGYAEKMREARGWVAISQAEGWYTPSAEVDLALPNVVDRLGWDKYDAAGWVGTQIAFDHLLRDFVRPGMRVLEVGAAKAWAGRFFVEQGCEYTACDVLTDPNIGLGRARFFIERSGHFERVAADFEALPFRSESFDLVFAIAALHHALDLRQMVSEMARVCRVGGVVAGLNEGVRAFTAPADAAKQAAEKSYGINEHVYTLTDYMGAFVACGLRPVGLERAAGYHELIARESSATADALLRVPVVGAWLAPLVLMGFVHPYDGLNLFARK